MSSTPEDPKTAPAETQQEAPAASPGAIGEFIRKRFFAGLITIIPAIITIWAVVILTNAVQGVFGPFVKPPLNRLAAALDGSEEIPQLLVPYRAFVEPLTILLSLFMAVVLIVAVGWMSRFLIFRRVIRLGESTVQRIPLIRFFYKTPKEVLRTITQSKGSMKRVVLIEYPRRGIWCIAYATGEMSLQPDGREMVTVFLPTTPNPTSGFLLILPKDDVRDINLGTEQAVRFIISAGILSPAELHTAQFAGLDRKASLPPPPPELSMDLDPDSIGPDTLPKP